MKSKIVFLIVIFLFVSFSGFSQEKDNKISLNFKDVGIKVVLDSLAEKSGVNIVASPDVQGMVSIKLKDVSWQTALDVIMKTYGYGYEWIDEDIVMVTTLEELTKKRKQEAEAAKQEPLETVTYKTKYLDANDLKDVISKQLTARGRVTVLRVKPQKGWRAQGGVAGSFNKAQRESGADEAYANRLIIRDTKSNIRDIMKAIKEIDIRPQQVLIEARIMEVNRDALTDIGLDWGTGSSVESGTLGMENNKPGDDESFGIIDETSQVTPSVFDPVASDITGTWSTADTGDAFNSGISFAYQKLTGTQFEVLLHALEEDADTNTLSAPRIMTLDGQEAYILVGTKRPVIKSELSQTGDDSSATTTTIVKDLNTDVGSEGWLRFGIQLNVVPEVCANNKVRLNLYPSVTSSTSSVEAVSKIKTTGEEDTTTTDSYPIVTVRETQTQVLMRDGETIVIGGLLKDVKKHGTQKIPFLGDIPLLGKLFQRETTDTAKIDLVIFITAHLIEEGEFTPQRISQIEKRMGM